MALGLFGLPAQAFIITVGGVDYDVVFTAGSYNSVNGDPATPLTTTPWFGDPALAADLASALQTADVGGAAGLPDDSGSYVFVRTVDAVGFIGRTYVGTTAPSSAGTTGDLGTGFTSTTFFGSDLYFASAAPPAAVPEIDGNALAKALFILFALGAWLHTRRARVS
ncbi:MAG: hypothetical protein ACE368_24400 [Paracoccaceae bacterium]